MAKKRRIPSSQPVVAAICLTLGSASSAAAQDVAAIDLVAERTTVKSDGRSTTVITARVFDAKGNAVQNGTRVRFTTTAGRLDTAVTATQNGVARVTLIAADQPGDALVVAVLDTPGQSVPAKITIAFRKDADNTQIENTWTRIEGTQYVGYVKDFQVIQANGKDGGASITYRTVTVTADFIQYNLKNNSILAKGNVTVANGDAKRQFYQLRFDFNREEGVAERMVEEGRPAPFYLKGRALEETPWEENRVHPSTVYWTPEDLSEASITIVSRSIAIAPNGTMQFRRATFYVDGNKTFSVPFHVMSPDQDSIYKEQVVGLGPNGITVDFPYYYDVRPRAIGTVYLRHGARISSSAYSNRPGWWFDMLQSYNGARGTNGSFELLGLSRPDWSARFRHGQSLDKNTTASLYMDFPYHRDAFVTSQLSRSFKSFSLSGTLAASRYQGALDPITGERGKASGDIRGQILAETVDRPMFKTKTVRYTLNASGARQSFYSGNALARGVLNSQTVGTRMYTTPFTVSKQTSFTQSLSVGHTWIQGKVGSVGVSEGASIFGTSALRRDFNGGNSAVLTYDYTQTPLLQTQTNNAFDSAYIAAKHRIGLNVTVGNGGWWAVNLGGTRGLDRPQTSLNGTFDVRFGAKWRGQITTYQSAIADSRYQEIQYGIFHTIASREFGVYYSTTYKRVQFDFSAARF